jgi:hypothetical protein
MHLFFVGAGRGACPTRIGRNFPTVAARFLLCAFFVGGAFAESIDVGNGPLAGYGGTDAWVSRF